MTALPPESTSTKRTELLTQSDTRSDLRKIISFWLVTRISLSFCALFCSHLYPRSPLEQLISIWPPRSPLAGWFNRVLLAPWDRWDVEAFLKIATYGYNASDGTSSFHPLHPRLAKLVGAVFGGNNLLGLFLLSNVCSLLFLLCFYQLARFDLARADARRATIYLLFLPAAFIIFTPYTESLFLLCSAYALLAARHSSWWSAGLAGGLAVLTRQQGLFLLVPLALELWESSERDWRKCRSNWRAALGLALIPFAYLLWIIYRALVLNDLNFAISDPGTWIYGLLVSERATQVVAEQRFILPWNAIWLALKKPDSANLIDLISGASYLLLLLVGWRRLWGMRRSYLVYSVIIIFISFSYHTGFPHSFMGLPRHCLLAFPLALPLATYGRSRLVNLILVAAGQAWLFGLTLFYCCKIFWVP